MRLSWFMLGLAAGFLVSAAISFALNGVLGFYYMAAGGASAALAVVVALRTSAVGTAVPRG